MYVNPDGSVLPCCVAHHHDHMGNVRKNSIQEIWNNDKYKSMRQKMLKGEKCSECSACYSMEEKGVKSVRQDTNDTYRDYIKFSELTYDDGTLDEMNLKHFDVRWSNICNFKCRSCSSTYSSTWAQEDNAQGQNKPVYILAGGDDNDNLYKQFEPYLNGIKTFYFAGGEPLLTDKHYQILEYLISIGNTNVNIQYNTNLSVLKYKNKSVLDLWKHFDDVSVRASLDSWSSRGEYIREGTDWNKVEENIKLIGIETPHVRLNTSTVVSIFNLYTITDFIDYLISSDLFDKDFDPYFYNIINPDFFSASVLNDEMKNRIVDKINKHKRNFNNRIQQQLEKIIQYVTSSNYDQELLMKLKTHTEKFDIIRNRSFANTFPELQDLWK